MSLNPDQLRNRYIDFIASKLSFTTAFSGIILLTRTSSSEGKIIEQTDLTLEQLKFLYDHLSTTNIGIVPSESKIFQTGNYLKIPHVLIASLLQVLDASQQLSAVLEKPGSKNRSFTPKARRGKYDEGDYYQR